MHLTLVALGGALGAALRWLLASAVQSRAGVAFPWATLAVNVLGCAAIGLMAGWLSSAEGSRTALRLFVVVGLLGGFTTMSAFAWETVSLADAGLRGRALLYVLSSNSLCLLATWAAFTTTRAARG